MTIKKLTCVSIKESGIRKKGLDELICYKARFAEGLTGEIWSRDRALVDQIELNVPLYYVCEAVDDKSGSVDIFKPCGRNEAGERYQFIVDVEIGNEESLRVQRKASGLGAVQTCLSLGESLGASLSKHSGTIALLGIHERISTNPEREGFSLPKDFWPLNRDEESRKRTRKEFLRLILLHDLKHLVRHIESNGLEGNNLDDYRWNEIAFEEAALCGILSNYRDYVDEIQGSDYIKTWDEEFLRVTVQELSEEDLKSMGAFVVPKKPKPQES